MEPLIGLTLTLLLFFFFFSVFIYTQTFHEHALILAKKDTLLCTEKLSLQVIPPSRI